MIGAVVTYHREKAVRSPLQLCNAGVPKPKRTARVKGSTQQLRQKQRATSTVTDNRDILERAASRLLEVETLDEAALRDLTQDLRKGAAGKAKVAMNG